MKKKTGILLTQLGTPKAPTTSAVRPYLTQFLNDPRVIDIPTLLRLILVNLIIVPFRAPKSAKIYQELWEEGGGESPLLTYTAELTRLLNERLNEDDIVVHMAMRYQEPSMDRVLEEMRLLNYDRIVVLPMFPHYASSSSGSAMQRAMEIISKWWVIPEVSFISQFYQEEFYIDALVQQAQLAVCVFRVAGVPVDAAVEHRAVKVAHEASDVPRGVGLAVLGVPAFFQRVHVLLESGLPVDVVALVEGVDLPLLRDLDVLVGQDELADGRVQGEAVDAVADGEHHDGGR